MFGSNGSARRMPRRISESPSGRVSVIISVALCIGGCAPRHVNLDHCWSISELKEGYQLSGNVIIMASIFTRPLMSPVACEGTSVIANTPHDSLRFRPNESKDPTESVFFRAKIEGVVRGTAQGRPMVVLNKVDDVVRVKPSWLKDS